MIAWALACGVIAAVPLRPGLLDGRPGCAMVVALIRAQTLTRTAGLPELTEAELLWLAWTRAPVAISFLAARLIAWRAPRGDDERAHAWAHILGDAGCLDPLAYEQKNKSEPTHYYCSPIWLRKNH